MKSEIREMIDKIKNFNPQQINESKNKNQGILLRNMMPFWIGSVNVLDGYIEEVHTYEEAVENDFHHSFYFSSSQAEKIGQEECMVFWINDHTLNYEWTNGEIPSHIVSIILDQIQIL